MPFQIGRVGPNRVLCLALRSKVLQAVGGLVGELDRECFHGGRNVGDWSLLQPLVNQAFSAESKVDFLVASLRWFSPRFEVTY